MLLPKSICVCFKSVAPRVHMANISFLTFFFWGGGGGGGGGLT